MEKQNRFKSIVTWTSLVAFILSVLVTMNVIGAEWSESISGAVAGILNMLVVFGVLNNPTDNTNF